MTLEQNPKYLIHSYIIRNYTGNTKPWKHTQTTRQNIQNPKELSFISCTNQKTITRNIPKYLQNKTLKDPHKY